MHRTLLEWRESSEGVSLRRLANGKTTRQGAERIWTGGRGSSCLIPWLFRFAVAKSQTRRISVSADTEYDWRNSAGRAQLQAGNTLAETYFQCAHARAQTDPIQVSKERRFPVCSFVRSLARSLAGSPYNAICIRQYAKRIGNSRGDDARITLRLFFFFLRYSERFSVAGERGREKYFVERVCICTCVYTMCFRSWRFRRFTESWYHELFFHLLRCRRGYGFSRREDRRSKKSIALAKK